MTNSTSGRTTPAEVLVEMARLKGLSDGVVAFALTLVVLDIRVPAGVSAADLPRSVLALAPDLAVYFISFTIIGGAWGSHQRMLGQLSRGDGLLVWFTLLSLLPVTLLPACASLLGDYPAQLVAITVFAIDAMAIQLTEFWLWRHASRRGLVNPTLDPRIVDGIGRRLLVNASAFGISIPLALLNPAIAYVTWLALFALVFTTDWLSWQQAIRTVEASIPLDGANRANVRLVHGGAKLRVDTLDGDGALLEGVFGGGVDTTVERGDADVDVGLGLPRLSGLLSSRYPWAWGRSVSPDWDLGLTSQIPITLGIDAGASRIDLDLAGLKLAELTLRSNASSVEIVLPRAAGLTSLVLQANASTLTARVPEGVALWIRVEGAAAEFTVDPARVPVLVEGREYRSTDYDKARNKVEIQASLSAGSLAIV